MHKIVTFQKTIHVFVKKMLFMVNTCLCDEHVNPRIIFIKAGESWPFANTRFACVHQPFAQKIYSI